MSRWRFQVEGEDPIEVYGPAPDKGETITRESWDAGQTIVGQDIVVTNREFVLEGTVCYLVCTGRVQGGKRKLRDFFPPKSAENSGNSRGR